MSVDVIIPTYKPGQEFAKLLSMLEKQTVKVQKVFVINTQEQFYDADKFVFSGSMDVRHITEEEFDHGRTRHEGILSSDADYCLLMTMDAIPADEYLVEKLLSCFSDESVAVAYARQLPNNESSPIERLSREYNYPCESRIKTRKDIDTMGIKAFFCSDVCAMYDRKKYLSLGGFIKKTIFNEDMIMAYRILMSGYGVYYCSEAKVFHSHNYTNMQQLHRNFDLGVSQADNPDVFSAVSSESEGINYIKRMSGALIREKKGILIPYLIVNGGFRFLGYRLGINYKKLPKTLVKKLSMNRNYWI